MISACLKLAKMEICLRRTSFLFSQPFVRSFACVVCPRYKAHSSKLTHCTACLQARIIFETKRFPDIVFIASQTGVCRSGPCHVRLLSSEFVPQHRGKSAMKNDLSSFSEKENEYFHLYLEISSEYKPYLLSSVACCQQSDELTKQALDDVMEGAKEGKAEAVISILKHWCVKAKKGHNVPADAEFGQVVQLIGKYASKMLADKLIESMAYLSRMGFRESDLLLANSRKHRILLSKALDKVCSRRVKELTVKQLLLAADFFYMVRGSAFTEFPYLMFGQLKNHLADMTRPELLMFLFHISLARRSPPRLLDAILERLEPDMASLSLQELGIVNLAHYKSQLSLRQPSYFQALTQQLKDGAGSDLDPIGLSAVLKYQQKTLNRKKDSFLPQFFTLVKEMEEPLLSRISSLPSETLMHVLNLYYSLDLLSEDVYMAVIKRIVSQGLKDWRVKDIARVAHIVTNLPLGNESRMETVAEILSELRKPDRLAERRTFYGCMLQVAVAMTVCSVYPHWLAQEIFSDAFQSNFRGSDIDWRRDLYHLSESILIEDETYQGPLLWPENFPKLSKNKVYGRLKGMSARGITGKEQISNRDWALLDLMDTLREINPRLQAQPVFLLSHFQTADIEITPSDLQELQEMLSGKSKKMAACHLEPADTAVVLHASNAYQQIRCRDGRIVHLLRQYHAMRAHQLRKLGTTVVEVSLADLQNANSKSEYLKQRFADANALEKLE